LAKVLDWRRFNEEHARLLERQTGEGLEVWNARIAAAGPPDEPALRAWLAERGVTGYARGLLVRERFGYPAFLTATADELVEGQYGDRPTLRPIYEALLLAIEDFGPVTVQTRKGYVSLVAPKRTFARIVPATRTRIDVGVRLAGAPDSERLKPSRIHETMRWQFSLESLADLDDEALRLLRRAYDENS
jgi:hypothetical protein